jgi:hypothetical protein
LLLRPKPELPLTSNFITPGTNTRPGFFRINSNLRVNGDVTVNTGALLTIQDDGKLTVDDEFIVQDGGMLDLGLGSVNASSANIGDGSIIRIQADGASNGNLTTTGSITWTGPDELVFDSPVANYQDIDIFNAGSFVGADGFVYSYLMDVEFTPNRMTVHGFQGADGAIDSLAGESGFRYTENYSNVARLMDEINRGGDSRRRNQPPRGQN